MHITKVRNNGIKGQSFERTLTPVSYIGGHNFSGKTTTADCLRLALCGYLPTVGKKAGDLWAALSGNSDEPGEISCSVEFDSGTAASFTIKRNAKGVCSADLKAPVTGTLDPYLLDVRSFFSQTAADRIATVFRVAGGDRPDATDLKQKLAAIEAYPTSLAAEMIGGLQEDIDKAMACDNWRGAVEALADKLDATAKQSRVEHKLVTGAFAGLALPLNQPKVPPDGTELRAKRDALIAKQGELRGILSRQQQSASRVGQLAKLRQDYELAKVAMAEIRDPGAKPTRTVSEEDLKQSGAAIGIIALEAQKLSVEMESVKRQRDGLAGVTICPTCGMHADLDEARKRFAERIAQIEAAEAKLNSEWDAANERQATLEERSEQDDQKLAEWEAACQELAAAKKRENDLAIAIAQAEQSATAESADETKRIEELNRELVELPTITTALEVLERAKQARVEFEALLKRRAEMENRGHKEFCTAEVCTQARKILSAEILRWSEASFGKILGVANRITDGLLNSPLEFIDGELGRRVSELDVRASRSAKVGAWIPWKSFSGTEELVGMAAFGLALAAQGTFRLLILDEIGRLDGTNSAMLNNRVNAMVKDGAIDQAIMIEAADFSLRIA